MNEGKFIEPSNKARFFLLGYIVLLALIVFYLKTEFDNILPAGNASQEQLDMAIASVGKMIDYLLLFTVLQAILFSAYFVMLANQSIKSGQFPPPGTAVVKRTRISTGRKAFFSACLAYLIAVFMWCLILIPQYLKWILAQFT